MVFVVSGKELYAVSEFFGQVKGLGLGAEHGFYYKWPLDGYVMTDRVRRIFNFILFLNSRTHLIVLLNF